MGSSIARRRFVQPLRRILLSMLHLVVPAVLSKPAFKSGACDLCALEVVDWITVTPLCAVDETGIDLWKRITSGISVAGTSIRLTASARRRVCCHVLRSSIRNPILFRQRAQAIFAPPEPIMPRQPRSSSVLTSNTVSRVSPGLSTYCAPSGPR